MKRPFLVGISLLAVSACVPPAAPPPAAPAPVAQPAGTAPGSPTNTTAAFDGSYGRPVVTAKNPAGCADLSLPPYLVIQSGRGLLQGYNLSFQGYVSPQGALAMTDGFGRVFQGQIDPRFAHSGRVTSANCTYDMAWSRARRRRASRSRSRRHLGATPALTG